MRRFCSPSGLIAAFAIVMAGAASSPLAVQASEIAPGFSIRSLDGHGIRFSDYRGRPVILDFWATWCGPCRATMPHLDDMQNRFGKDGLAVLGLSVDEGTPQSVRRFAQRLGVHFTLGMANESILDLYGPIRSIPTTFFINRKGEIVRRVVGYIDEETLESYVRELF